MVSEPNYIELARIQLPYPTDNKYFTRTRISEKFTLNTQNTSERRKAITASIAFYTFTLLGTFLVSTLLLPNSFNPLPSMLIKCSLPSLALFMAVRWNSNQSYIETADKLVIKSSPIAYFIRHEWIINNMPRKERENPETLKGFGLSGLPLDELLSMLNPYSSGFKRYIKPYFTKESLPIIKKIVDSMLDQHPEITNREQLETYQFLQSLDVNYFCDKERYRASLARMHKLEESDYLGFICSQLPHPTDNEYLTYTRLSEKFTLNTQNISERRKAIIASIAFYTFILLGTYLVSTLLLPNSFSPLPSMLIKCSLTSLAFFMAVRWNRGYEYDFFLFQTILPIERLIRNEWMINSMSRKERENPETFEHFCQSNKLNKNPLNELQRRLTPECIKPYFTKECLPIIKATIDLMLDQHPEITNREQLETYQFLQSQEVH